MEFALKFLCDSQKKAEIAIRQTTLQDVLKQMLDHLKKLPKAHIFLTKVGKKDAPGYYDVIKNPMDLGTMTKKLHLYRDLDQFQEDIDLIVSNCLLFNASAAYYVECAMELKQETDILLRRFQKVFPRAPEALFIEGFPSFNPRNDMARTVAKYLKRVGFQTYEKQCFDVLCDVFIYKLKELIHIGKTENNSN
ncbi:Bromodomain-containing protein 1 [Glugoides intestinalis]